LINLSCFPDLSFRFGLSPDGAIVTATNDKRIFSLEFGNMSDSGFMKFGDVVMEIFGFQKLGEYLQKTGYVDESFFS
jgi:hypothetical protein